VADTVERPAFFDATFQEALELTRQAREYLAYQDGVDRRDMDPQGRLLASCESMRMTARLTQVMAWLLVQKAVHAGEMTPEDAVSPELRLSGQEVCAESDPRINELLQPGLLELLDRSRLLYERVARLDAMLDEAAPGGQPDTRQPANQPGRPGPGED